MEKHRKLRPTLLFLCLLTASLGVSGVIGQPPNWEYVSNEPVEMSYPQLATDGKLVYTVGDWTSYELNSTARNFDRLWILDPVSSTWTYKLTNGGIPPRRLLHCLAVVGSKLYMFGGITATYNNELFELDLITLTWKQIQPLTADVPPTRYYHNCFEYGSKFYVYAGKATSSVFLNDLWYFDPGNGLWKRFVYNSELIPTRVNTIANVWRDKLVVFGGMDSKSTAYSRLVEMEFGTGIWREYPVYGLQQTVINMVPGIVGDYLYAFSGTTNRYSWDPYQRMLVIDLGNKSLVRIEDYYDSKNVYLSYPISAPQGATNAFAMGVQNRLLLVGGQNYFGHWSNQVWVYEEDLKNWTRSSLSLYPHSRAYAKSSVDQAKNRILMFGGLVPHGKERAINDLWEMDQNGLWKRLSQEVECPHRNLDCAPLVLYPIVSSSDSHFYVIGGLPDTSVQTMDTLDFIPPRRFSYELKLWETFLNDSLAVKTFYSRHSSAFLTIKNILYVFAGLGHPKAYKREFYNLDLSTLELVQIYYDQKATPSASNNSQAFERLGRFCLYGGTTDEESYLSDYWCFDQDAKKWTQGATYTNINLGVVDAVVVGHSSTMLLYSGIDMYKAARIQFFATDGKSWRLMPDPQFKPTAITQSTSQVINNRLYIMTGRRNDPTQTHRLSYTSSVVSFDLRKLWCSGNTMVTTPNGSVEDGSGALDYLPSSECSWTFTQATAITITSLALASGANVIFESFDSCSGNILTSTSSSVMIMPNSTFVGTTLSVPSGSFKLTFRTGSGLQTSQGFRFDFFNCGRGYTPFKSSCVCAANRFINYRGDCIPCPDGYAQPLENQKSCLLSETNGQATKNTSRIDLDVMKPGQAKALFEFPTASLYGAAVAWRSKIIMMGGIASHVPGNEIYHSLDKYYSTERPVMAEWSKMKASGFIPPSRYQFCFVAMDKEIILIGGTRSGSDESIYSFDPELSLWARKGNFANQTSGALCARYGAHIVVHGGVDRSGSVSGSTWRYNLEKDTWVVVKSSPMIRANAAGGVYQSRLYVFGGSDGRREDNSLVYLDMITEKWVYVADTFLSKCIRCDNEKGICNFARQLSAYGIFGSELHIYGGLSKSTILQDILVISLETGEVVHRENYGLLSPKFPLSHPPPKFGSSFVSSGDSLMILGGGMTSSSMGSSTWTWSSALRTWSDSSIALFPLERKEPSVTLINEKQVLMFGGSTEYFDQVLLNDIWKFDLEKSSWTLIWRESSTSGPSGRAGAAISYYQNSICIFGGRTSVREEDRRFWTFSIDKKIWTSFIFQSASESLRPLSRVGMAILQDSDNIWLWGGQLAPGLLNYESYSAIFQYSVKENRMEPFFSPGIDPKIRKSAQIGMLNNNNRMMVYGGLDFQGNPISDGWILDFETKEWYPMDYKLDFGPNSSAYGGAGVSITNTSIIIGGYGSNGQSSSVAKIFQHDWNVGSTSQLDISDLGMVGLTDLAGLANGGVALTFGGTDGSVITNQAFAYKPGFCHSDRVHSIISSKTVSSFDDGSGVSKYFVGTNCTWILQNATHLVVSHNIALSDKLIITDNPLRVGVPAKKLYESSGSLKAPQSIYSASGFLVHLISPSSDARSRGACDDCDGFTIKHAACGINAEIHSDATECSCIQGFIDSEGQCIQDLTEGGPGVDSLPIAVGLSVGVLVLATFAGAYYRRRLMTQITGVEMKYLGEILFEDLTLRTLIGSGSFGEVFRGDLRGVEVAIKKLTSAAIEKGSLVDFKQEISVMVGLRHPNILLYMGACFHPQMTCLVCEFMEKGSLYDVLMDEMRPLSYQTKVQYLLDIAKGMQYLHNSTPPIIHRDLKSLNILLDDRDRCKISDFGLSTLQNISTKSNHVGSLLWLAPEALSGGEYTLESDVYSFGIIMSEVTERKEPFEGRELASISYLVVYEKLRPSISEATPRELFELIAKCWDQEPSNRPTFTQILKEIALLNDASKSTTTYSTVSSYGSIRSRQINGTHTIVYARALGIETMWDAFPDYVPEILQLYNERLQHVAKACGGCVMQAGADVVVVSFDATASAFEFAMISQEDLNEASWPTRLIDHAGCENKLDGQLRGLRVAMGIHRGHCNVKKADDSAQGTVSGEGFVQARIACHQAVGGQILVSAETWKDAESIVETMQERWILQGPADDSSSKLIQTYGEICSRKLKKRIEYFHEKDFSSYPEKRTPQVRSQELDSAFENPDSPKTRNPQISDTNDENSIISNKTIAPPWMLQWQDIAINDTVVGRGSFGSVFTGKYKGELVAVKRIPKMLGDQRSTVMFLSEVAILKRVKHKNIVNFIGASMSGLDFAIVTDYIQPGSLRDLLHKSSVALTPQQKMGIIRDVIAGMIYLHSQEPLIIHRDLKPGNILVDANHSAYICDFGLSRLKSTNRTMTKCGTPAYQPPEILKGMKYDERVDVYSFAIVCWEILTRELPYPESAMANLSLNVVKGERPPRRSSISDHMWSVLIKAWNGDPLERPSFSTLQEWLVQ